MNLIEITNIKKFTTALFAGETFDSFCVTEASFSTLFSVSIDGHINQDFLKGPGPAASEATGTQEIGSADAVEGMAARVAEESAYQTAAPEGPFDEVIKWGQIRSLCYNIVKGKRLPVRFRIIFMTPPEKVAGFLASHDLTNYSPSEINALFMNVYYEGGKLTCTTGVSMKSFSMDKSIERAWDESVVKFISRFE